MLRFILVELAARRVRFIGDSATRIAEDYLRILRFFRSNQDEELTHDDIKRKFDVSDSYAYVMENELINVYGEEIEKVTVFRHRSKGIAR